MTHISYDARAAERRRSILGREIEQPRTLADALRAWLQSRNPDLMPQAQRLAIASRIERHAR